MAFAGSTFGFGCNILPVFEQLGLLEDMMRVSYPTYSIDMYDSHLNPVGGFSFKHYKKKYWPMGERETLSRLSISRGGKGSSCAKCSIYVVFFLSC